MSILKDYIQHLKYEIIEKNKDIHYKNYLLNKSKVETSSQSSFSSVNENPEVYVLDWIIILCRH